ncbi:peroxisome membrane protein [Umbelopsis sp. AD052]|nr:peroxisome membrane protein [Umbelopsis sp. AD052]
MATLAKYQKFLVKQAPRIETVESWLRQLSLVIPGRFEDSDFVSQILVAVLNLISLYHDSLLWKVVARHAAVITLPSSLFNRYTRHWYRDPKFKRIALTLTLVSYCEVVAEMWIKKKYSEKTRWRFVVWVEALKAVCRYQLFKVSGGRMLLHPSHPQRDIDPSTLELAEDSSDFDPRTGGVHYHSKEDKQQWDHPDQLVLPLQGLAKFGEIAWIVRPLVYVLAVRKFGSQSWKAWIMSLVVDLTSRGLMHSAFSSRKDGQMTPLEADEYGRRAYLLLYYLLRGPFYEHFTKPRIEAFCDATETRPVASILAGAIRDYQPLWEDVFFYTAGS